MADGDFINELLGDIDPEQEQEFLAGLTQAMTDYKRRFSGQEYRPDQDSFTEVQAEANRIMKLHGVKLTKSDPEWGMVAKLTTENDPQKFLDGVRSASEAKKQRTLMAPLRREYEEAIKKSGLHREAVLKIRQDFRRRGLDI